MSWLALAAAALPAQAPPGAGDPLTSEVQRALERARPELRRHLEQARNGQLALVCLAALHDEFAHDDPKLVAAIRRLAHTNLSDTYSLALRLMVMEAMPEFPGREELARRDARVLLDILAADGFGYHDNDGRADLSNTQYGALGMRAAAALQCKVPLRAWRVLAAAVMRAQLSDGGFTYSMGGASSGAYLSMTVAGIAALEICMQHLPPEKTPRGLARRIDKAWEWMQRNQRDIGNAGIQHSFYAHYGLERAAILSDKATVGDVDWYRAGASMFLTLQARDGGWNGGRNRMTLGNEVDTAFAVLFLRRKFQRQAGVAGPVTLGGGYLTRGLPEQATEEQVRRAVELDVARGMRAVPDLLKALRDDLAPRRKAAALALIRLSGQDFGYHPDHDAEKRADAIKAAELWWFTEGRKQIEQAKDK